MADEDELIGQNVARFREPRSQADVAKAMRARGWKWAQNTVSAIEQGERPLRFAEAIDLAEELGVIPVDAFARESNYVQFKILARAASDAASRLVDAVDNYRGAQLDLAIAGDELLEAGAKPTNEIVGPLKSWLSKSASSIALETPVGDEDAEFDARDHVQTVREGREDRGANGVWMNVLFDTNYAESLRAVEHFDVKHPETS